MEKKSHKKKINKDGLALGKLGNFSDMMSMGKKKENILERLDLKVVEEDPNNPRTVYDPAKMRELAQSIRERTDLLTPISVRENPEKPGFYIVNHGHRRLRASKMARKQKILAFIDNNFHKDFDQLIDNIQRENLSMMDIANSIGRALAHGIKQKDLAEKLGKSTSYVSQYAKLLDLPEGVSRAILKGQIADVLVAYDLINIEKKHPAEVMAVVLKEPEITRPVVEDLKRALNSDTAKKAEKPASVDRPAMVKAADDDNDNDEQTDEVGDDIEPMASSITSAAPKRDTDEPDDDDTGEDQNQKETPVKMRKPVLTVMKGKQLAYLVLDRKPKSPKHIWIRYDNEHLRIVEVPITSISLVEVNEG